MAYIPLTEDQYNNAIKSGFSHDRIVANEKIRKQSTPDYSLSGGDVSSLVAPVLNPQGAFNAGKKIIGAGVDSTKEAFGGLRNTWENAPSRFMKDVQSGADMIKPNAKGVYEVPNIVKGLGTSAFRTAGDAVGTLFAPVGEAIGAATGTINKLFPVLGKTYDAGVNAVADKISNIPEVQKFAVENPNAGEDFGRALNLIMAASQGGEKITGKGMIDATKKPLQNISDIINGAKTSVKNKINPSNDQIIANRVSEIAKIENNYAQTRKALSFSKDANVASRTRIASTDILANSVDENGLITTKQPGGPIDQYKAMTIDKAEGVVRNGLEKEGLTVNLNDIESQLTKSVKASGLQGKNLISALSDIQKEIEGYRLSADTNGNVPTTLIHDAKIDTTNSIDYNTPPEVKAGRKAIANGLKTLVEDNSNLNVKEINGELQKYLQDINLLENLDGKRVKGGKLGKYFAQISGNIVGGAAGSVIGGPLGAATGTVLGGELAGKIKSSSLKGTLGGETGNVAPESDILNKAVQDNAAPRLALPEPAPGSPRSSIGSGPTINIPPRFQTTVDENYSKSLGSRNAMYQPNSNATPNASNTPIDFKSLNGLINSPEFNTLSPETQALFKKLSEWASNQTLPSIFKTELRKGKNLLNLNKEIKPASSLPQYTPKVNKLSTKTPILSKADPLILEAKKYKTAEEFVKAQNKNGYITVYHRTNSPVENFGKGGIYSKENAGEFFVSNKKIGQAEGYGKNVIELRVKKSDLSINDEFPGGEIHYTLDTKKADQYLKQKSQLTDIWNKANKK